MLAEINSALQSIKIISDLLKANKSINNYNELLFAIAEVNSKLISAQDLVLSYQIRNKALSERITELEEKFSNKEEFNREITKYRLHKLKSGMLVYKIKPEHEEIGEPHYICTDCASNEKISLFQSALNGTRLVCDSCKKNVITGFKDR